MDSIESSSLPGDRNEDISMLKDGSDDKNEGFDEKLGENLSLASNDVVKDGDDGELESNGVEVVTEGGLVVEEVKVDGSEPGVAVVSNTEEMKGEYNGDEDEDEDEDEDVLLVGGSDDGNPIVETPGLETDDGNDVKVASEGGSADSVETQAIVVTKVEDETPGLKTDDGNDVKVATEGDSIDSDGTQAVAVTKVEDETPGLETDDGNDVKVASEGGSADSVETQAVVATKVEDETPGLETDDGNSVKVASEGDSVGTQAVTVTKVEDVTPGLETDDGNSVKVASEGDSVGTQAVAVTKVDDETPGLETDDGNDVKVASEGDSVETQAVTVTKVEDVTPGLETDDGNNVKVASEGDSVETHAVTVTKVEDETPDLVSVGGDDGEVNSEGDSVVEAVDVDLPVPGVAVVTKTEEGGSGEVEGMDSVLEKVVDKEVVGVTDGKFSPLDVEVEDVEKEVDYAGQEDRSVAVNTGLDSEAVSGDADNGQENLPADDDESAVKDDDDEEEEGGGGGGDSSNIGEGSSQERESQMIDGQIVTDSDEEDNEEDAKELFDSAALSALLKAAADGSSEGGNITFTSQDGSRLFTVERPAGLGPSLQAARAAAAPRPPRANIFNPSGLVRVEDNPNLTEEERKKLEKLQSIRVKFLRLVHRLGLTPDEPVAAQVLYRLALIAGRQTGQSFSLDAAKQKAMELESNGNEDLDFTVNILVLGKAGTGKSATINSIFGEEKTVVGAFQPGTSSVKEIRGSVGGVAFRVFDTPGLRASIMEQGFNRSVLSTAKKFMKKNPADVVLYVDRLDARTRDHNDIPLLKTITSSLGPAIWRSAIVTLTHAASAPPEGSNGTPLSYEMFVTQRSHVVQQAIGHAVGDLRMMSPSLMNPVSLVENHQSCRKNREGQKVLPNGQTWRPQLLMLCYSIKILAEANALSKPHDPYDSRKLFGFRMRSPPLPYMLSSMLQSWAHPKLPADQGGDGGDSDVDLAELTDDDEDEDEYDQLPPFKPLKKSQLSKLSKEQKKAYYDEYDYRVKLLQKKQWKEELRRMKEIKTNGGLTGQSSREEEGDVDAPASVAVPLPDMALPPSFDGDNPAYRFRFLEPTSQFLARPVLDTHGWDHDVGYDGVNVEQTLAIANRFPAAVNVQVTKDKKDFSINMDSSVSVKHNEKTSSMAGFDIQPIGKQLAYIVRGETKFKNLKRNKTAAGISVTFLGENVVTGFKVEDQIMLGRQYSIVGSAGTVRFQSDSAYGANIEVQRRELDYPIGQIQSTVGLSIIKWRGDLALGFNSLAQFSAGRNSKVAVRAGINNKMSGQITVKTSSSEYLSLALAAVIPSLLSAYRKLRSDAGERYSAY